jgi:hypothetical protein
MVFNGARLESKFVYVSQRLRILTAGAIGTHAEPYGQAVRTSPGRAYACPEDRP